LRETIERSLGALLVSRRVQATGDCSELADILSGWDGHLNVLMRKRISRHIESCDVCDEERRRLVNPVALLGAAPVFVPAPAWLRDRTLSEVQLTSASSPLTNIDDDPKADDRTQSDGIDAPNTHGYLIPVVVFVIALIAATAAVFMWLGQKAVPIAPTEVSTTAPAPAPPPPPSLAPPPPPPVSITTTVAPAPPATPPTRTRVAPLPPPPSSPVATTPVAEPTSPPSPPPPVEPPVPPPPPPPPLWPDWMPDWSPPPPPSPPGGGGTPPLVIDPVIPPGGSTALP
jgi:hypothetical protein